MQSADLVIVGGGVAGLAAAVTAARMGASAIVLEAAHEPGGLVRSHRAGGYTFDRCGHVLHLARPETRALIDGVTAPGDWLDVERRSAVWMCDRLVPYPFQLHLAHAPPDVRDECLAGLPRETAPFEGDPHDVALRDWIEATLGAGIAKHFMVPYNEKLATVPIDELTCAWLGRFAPRPALADVRDGARSARTRQVGYNQRFRYPRAGGIDLVWKALAATIVPVRRSARVRAVDVIARTVVLETGERIRYREAVIASVPLDLLVGLVSPASPAFVSAPQLRANSVTCVNLGVRRLAPTFRGPQWIYLPERRFRAYRVGFYGGLSPATAPPGREGVYVEIAHADEVPERVLVDAAVADLTMLGAIGGRDDVEVVLPVRIRRAYVIHDRRWAPARAALLRELEARRIYPVGRYGRWEYASIDDALAQGIQAPGRALTAAGEE